MPVSVTLMTWSRESASVFLAEGSETSGRMPVHAERTSSRRTLRSEHRYFETSPRIHLISCSVGDGSRSIRHGESVVPTIVWPCHGRKKMTRPSDVDGSISPILCGE
eukprot:Amastigsp_a841337_6.p4 type:complete len:107 gc:universal Amastigsp_a841337_6:931-1251(+)